MDRIRFPEGNLFKPGTDLTRPEIYTMGHRNPFRISIDSKTDYLYWGEVGPDAAKPAADRGPKVMTRLDRQSMQGNQGWPHFAGDNKAYYGMILPIRNHWKMGCC